MSEKFTPGPWKACRAHEDFDGPLYDIDEDEVETYEAKPFVGICSEHETITAAHDLFWFKKENAHLIAAAPEIYNALDSLVAIVGLTAFKYEGQRQVLQEAVDMALAVLKKARGEQ